MGALRAVAGTLQSWTIPFLKNDGTPYTLFTTLNTLTALMSAGDGQAPLSPGLTASYVIASPIDHFILTAPGASTVNLAPGFYEVLVTALVGSEQVTAWRGEIEILGRPGSGTPPAVYCSYRDLEGIYPTIANMLRIDSDGSGFLAQRKLAKAEVDIFLIERYDPQPGMNRRRSGSSYNASVGFDVQDLATVPPTPAQLRTALAAGGLIRNPPDDSIVAEIAARLTVARILERQSANDPRYSRDAEAERTLALDRLRMYRAFVDINADGIADVLINRDVIFLT